MDEQDLKYMKESLDYDKESGNFYRKNGKLAGAKSFNGYWVINIHLRQYRRSRLSFLFTHGKWPRPFVDHIDGDRLNDAPSNLRECTRSQNMWNQRSQKRMDSSIPMGVYRTDNAYEAQIQKDGKRLYLGRFKTVQEAAEAYQSKRKELFGEFA